VLIWQFKTKDEGSKAQGAKHKEKYEVLVAKLKVTE
jgi:hypothetical protein